MTENWLPLPLAQDLSSLLLPQIPGHEWRITAGPARGERGQTTMALAYLPPAVVTDESRTETRTALRGEAASCLGRARPAGSVY